MNDKLLIRFCRSALFDGLAYIFLLGVAMPIKYYGNADLGKTLVFYTGWVHGVFFVAYIIFLIKLALRDGWKTGRIALAFFATFIPFALFYVDWKIRKSAKAKSPALRAIEEN